MDFVVHTSYHQEQKKKKLETVWGKQNCNKSVKVIAESKIQKIFFCTYMNF